MLFDRVSTRRAQPAPAGSVCGLPSIAATLPPIDVVRVCDAYAVRDGHHRVSVALARGALTIDAVVE